MWSRLEGRRGEKQSPWRTGLYLLEQSPVPWARLVWLERARLLEALYPQLQAASTAGTASMYRLEGPSLSLCAKHAAYYRKEGSKYLSCTANPRAQYGRFLSSFLISLLFSHLHLRCLARPHVHAPRPPLSRLAVEVQPVKILPL